MKRCGINQRCHHFRVAKKRWKRKKSHNLKKAVLKRLLRNFTILKAPEVFTLANKEHRSNLLEFLDRLRHTIGKKRQKTLVDFSGTSKFASDGTLLFSAELFRLKRITQNLVALRCRPPKNVKAKEVLQQIGVFKALNYHSNIKPSFQDVVRWRVASGNEVLGEKYDDILGPYDGVLTPALETEFFNSLTEAMTNCHHHAYIDVRKDGLECQRERKDWWMFSQERNGGLTVVFCDLGVGIPASLPTTHPGAFQSILASLKAGANNVLGIGKDDDAAIIKEAVKYSRTRTQLAHRGKGLKQLTEAIASTEGGRVIIYSNHGYYSLQNGQETVYNFDDSILGTLIQWYVPLPSQSR